MIELEIFGGAVLRRDGQPLSGQAVQRRRVALLAILACAGEKGVSRDKLVALLWPDQEAEAGRHALSQWLFLTRRDLGAPDLITGSAELRLNAARITVDAASFDQAIHLGDQLAAAERYTGPLLDGFHLADAPDFERWLDGERERRHAQAVTAMEEAARAAESRGDSAAAITWLRRIAAVDPLNGRAAANLMHALAANGDTSGALLHARSHTQAVHQELEAAPSPEVANLAMRLRNGDAASPPLLTSGSDSANGDPYLAFLRHRLRSRFHLHRIIRRTSLATAFEASALQGQERVTVKVILPEIVSRTNVQRLVAALEMAGEPRHEHLAPIGEVGTLDGLIFLVSPPLVASTLRERLDRERVLRIDASLDIAIAIASALVCAEGRDLPHLDLTPRRVLMAPPEVRVLDLGLMHAVVTGLAHNPAESGAALGTPAYMSPEQLTGERIVGRLCDVYSIGCILYHMLTGQPPHAAPSSRALLAQRLRDDPPRVRDLRDRAPIRLDDLIAKSLARTPQNRLSSAAEFEHELRSIRAAI